MDKSMQGIADDGAGRAAGGDLGAAPRATLLVGGERVAVPAAGISVGRRSDNDVVLATERASRHHARIASDGDRWFVADLESMNGTYLNGERLAGQSRWLTSGDTVTIGGEALRFVTGDETSFGKLPTMPARTAAFAFTGARMSIGRDASNDVVLDDPNVSRFHAEVAPADGAVVLRDLGSSNGTRLDGVPIGTARAALGTGAEIGVGPYRLLFDGGHLLARDDRGRLRLDARDLSVVAGDRTILDRATLSIAPGQLVAIIGESGSGKTTLLKALAGVSAPTSGTVTVSGEPVAARSSDVGYVPQTDIVHGQLTVREALTYAGRLRLPEDASRPDVDAAVARVMREVALEEHADTRIALLSGGQRKRAAVAVELLGRPSLLFLDEPTTGLDPELETRLMRLLRDLAGGHRAIAVVTHATKNLALCDRVAVMGRGGQLAFFGTPADALEFFGVATLDDVYGALLRRPSAEWRQLFDTRVTPPAGEPAGVAGPGAPARRRRALPQARLLAARYLTLFVRDRRNVAILLGQVPLLAIAMAGLFATDVFAFGRGHAGSGAQLLFLLVITAVWLGSIDAAREIVKERSVLEREAAAGVRLHAYLGSKAIVLFALAALQTLALAAIVLALRPLHASPSAYASVLVLLVLTSWAAVAMGLLISAWVRSQDQATSFIPLALIPQLFFAGAIVGVERMGDAIAPLSKLAFAQWAFAGSGTAAGMTERIAADPPFAATNGFGTHFFDLHLATAAVVLSLFIAVLLAAVGLVLRRRART
jgi:ABC-type multidrug transport system ATPase subunit